MVYLEACERHDVPANSAVIAQLQLRVRLMQPGPWQRLMPDAVSTPGDIVELLLGHVHPLPPTHPQQQQQPQQPRGVGSGPGQSANHGVTLGAAALAAAGAGPGGALYAGRAVAHVCRLVDPRAPWEAQCAAAGLPADPRVVSQADFQRLLEAAAEAVPLEELRQAALEVLGRPVGHGTLDVEGLAGALFDYLDVMGQGGLLAAEVRAVVARFSPAAATDMYGLLERHPQLARPAADTVSRAEFVSLLAALAPGLLPAGSLPAAVRDKAEVAVNALLDDRIRPEEHGSAGHAYDFSRAGLGPRGLLPLLDALGRDPWVGSLSLAHCGLGCTAVEALCGWLVGNARLTSLDLTGNPIADRGGSALAELLRAQPQIVELGIGSTHLLRRHSRTHPAPLGPSACEDAAPLLAALADNRAARRASPGEIVRALRAHGPELRALVYSLAGGRQGGGGGGARVPLGELRAALAEVTAEWGFTAEALDQVLSAERLLGTATPCRTAGEGGPAALGVTAEELTHFLRSDDQLLRVARAFRSRLAEAKALFFAAAPDGIVAPPGAATAGGGGGGAAVGVGGPRTALSTVRRAIVEAAGQPGSGWDVREADLEAVLSPRVLRPHMRAAATGNAPPVGALAPPPPPVNGAAGAPPGPVAAALSAGAAVRPDGTLAPEWAAGGGEGVAGGGGGGGGGGDMLISWPELCNTLLYLYNR